MRVALTVFNRLYRRLGRSYPVVFLTLELQSAFVITAATLGLFSWASGWMRSRAARRSPSPAVS